MQLSSILGLLFPLVLCNIKAATAFSASTTMAPVTSYHDNSAPSGDTTSFQAADLSKRHDIPKSVFVVVWTIFCLILFAALIGWAITTQSTIGRHLSVLRGSRVFVAVMDFQHWAIHHIFRGFLAVETFCMRGKAKINLATIGLWVKFTRRKVDVELAEHQRQQKA